MKRLCPKDKLRFEGFEGSLCPECDTESLPDLSGMVVAGRYELTKYLGIGGMRAPVYLATQISTRRKVAIKLLPILDERTVSRFEREARIASKLNHRHITIVHDYGQMDDNHMFLVMELLQGTSLRDLLRRESNLTVMRALNITEMLLRGLEHAHNHSVVHRDLKPDNVFLTVQDDESDFVKILDFGIAKHFDQDPTESTEHVVEALTQETVLCGTPLYMAPEQITQESFDARIDIYAIGIVMFQLMTGKLPFMGRTSYEILSKHLSERPPTLAQARPDLQFPPGLQDVISRALLKKPDGRFQTARGMREALREVRRGMGADTSDTDHPSVTDLRNTLALAGAVGTQRLSTSEAPQPEAGRSPWLWVAAALVLIAGSLVVWVVVSGGGSGADGSAAELSQVVQDAPGNSGDGSSVSAAGDKRPGAKLSGQAITAEGDKSTANVDSSPKAPSGGVGAVEAGAVAVEPKSSAEAGRLSGRALASISSAAAQAHAKVVKTTATFKLSSVPVGAQVSVNGTFKGKTPLEFALEPGAYTVVFDAEGYQPHTLAMSVDGAQAGQTFMQSVALARLAVPPGPSNPPTVAPANTAPVAPAVIKPTIEVTSPAKQPEPKTKRTPASADARKKAAARRKAAAEKRATAERAAAATKAAAARRMAEKKAAAEKKASEDKKKKKGAKIQILGGGAKPKVKVLK